MDMKSIEEADIKEGTKTLVRVDWNVPIGGTGEVLDASRIEASLRTIEYIKNAGGVPVIASHFGREGDSIQPVIDFARQNCPVLAKGVEFLENLRKNPGEEANSEEFAKELANEADFYVNEAFSVSHRKHASIVGVPKFIPAYVGFNFLKEFENLSQAFNPEHPFLFILGGAKFETKLPLVEKFLEIADDIFIGGANALPASGMSLADNPKVIFPIGDITALDANAETLEIIEEKIKQAQFILWNGPLGNYEKGFVAGTIALARMLADSNAKIIVGGGDTLAVVKEDIQKQISSHGFISTAGGAMLDFLANGTLPGIEALS
jgi:phosphoglycerate kinase